MGAKWNTDGARQRVRKRWVFHLVPEFNLPEASEGQGAQPAIDPGVAIVVVDAGEREAAGGGTDRMFDTGATRRRSWLVRLPSACRLSGARLAAPPAGDSQRTGAVLGGEEGDDGTKNLVGEVDDEIEADIAVTVASPQWFLVSIGSRFHRLGTVAAAAYIAGGGWPGGERTGNGERWVFSFSFVNSV